MQKMDTGPSCGFLAAKWDSINYSRERGRNKRNKVWSRMPHCFFLNLVLHPLTALLGHPIQNIFFVLIKKIFFQPLVEIIVCRDPLQIGVGYQNRVKMMCGVHFWRICWKIFNVHDKEILGGIILHKPLQHWSSLKILIVFLCTINKTFIICIMGR